MNYRREIDGLRAIAIIPVILFHCGFEAFSGGFLGVDVFFVISGYLITSIILYEKQQGTFTLIGFYERRARRILPALYLVIFTCLPFSWLYLTPSELIAFSESAITATTFLSNFYFRSNIGYFNQPADLLPLLHTWSLAVEEQYYLLFPVFLLITWRLGKCWILGMLAVIASISLIVSDLGSLYFPAATFYLLPTRGWELLIGVFTAFYLFNKKYVGPKNLASESISTLGLAAIAYAIYVHDRDSAFSSIFLLMPTLGTACIILFATPQTIIGKLLGTKLLVGIGLISYSAYLWHQPLFAFTKHATISTPGTAQFLTLGAFTLLLACFSWRYVEQPFRDRSLIGRKKIFILSGVGAIFFIVVGWWTISNNGFQNRFGNKTMAMLNTPIAFKDWQGEKCSPGFKNSIKPEWSCIGVKESIIGAMIGDSHSSALAFELEKALRKRNSGMRHFVAVPIFEAYEYRFKRKGFKSISTAEEIYQHVFNASDIQYVVFASRWTAMLEETRFNNGEGVIDPYVPFTREIIEGGKLVRHSIEKRKELMSQSYKYTIMRYLQSGKKIVLMYPVPETGWNVRKAAMKLKMNFNEIDLSTSHLSFIERNKSVYEIFDSIGEHPNLIRVIPEKMLCNTYVKNRCVTQLNGVLLYDDNHHLSSAGASLVVNEIFKHIDPLLEN